jgi:hypothetical protein
MAGLRVVEPPREIKAFPYFMAWHPRLTNEPAHAWFRELVSLIRTIQQVERWITQPVGGDIIFLPKAETKAKPRPKARSIMDRIRAFEERYNMKIPAIEKLAFDLLAEIEDLPKLRGKVTGDGSAWIVSTTLEQKNRSGDLTA